MVSVFQLEDPKFCKEIEYVYQYVRDTFTPHYDKHIHSTTYCNHSTRIPNTEPVMWHINATWKRSTSKDKVSMRPPKSLLYT